MKSDAESMEDRWRYFVNDDHPDTVLRTDLGTVERWDQAEQKWVRTVTYPEALITGSGNYSPITEERARELTRADEWSYFSQGRDGVIRATFVKAERFDRDKREWMPAFATPESIFQDPHLTAISPERARLLGTSTKRTASVAEVPQSQPVAETEVKSYTSTVSDTPCPVCFTDTTHHAAGLHAAAAQARWNREHPKPRERREEQLDELSRTLEDRVVTVVDPWCEVHSPSDS